MDITAKTLHGLADGLAKKEFSASEVVKAYIAKVDKDDADVKAFLKLDREKALAAAAAADERLCVLRKWRIFRCAVSAHECLARGAAGAIRLPRGEYRIAEPRYALSGAALRKLCQLLSGEKFSP